MNNFPIFPLNTVLFPGMPIKLHIFEERYKLMISRCYQDGQPFGVVLIKSGSEVGDYADIFAVGCIAQITQLEALSEGRFNLVAIGVDRFRILSLHHHQPYLTGTTEPFPFADNDAPSLKEQGNLLRPWVRKYLHTLAQTADIAITNQQLTQNPIRLAYMAAFLLNIPSSQKQELLSENTAQVLMERLRVLYRREVTLLDAMLRPQEPDESEPFSYN